MRYWLMKSEADCYSIDDLHRDKTTLWTEVRNYQARNFMMDMETGDRVLFYHSNGGDQTGVVGEALVSKTAIPDPSQFNKSSEYYDAKSTNEKPRWYCVEIKFKKKFKQPLYLKSIKSDKVLQHMIVAQKGSRLSITPVDKAHFEKILTVTT